MKILKLVVIFGSGFIIGGVAVGIWSGYLFSRLTVAKEVEVDFQSAQQAEWLAELRLGETTNAMTSMQNAMDGGVVAISQWADARPPDEKTRKARDGFLTNVKVYRESYPASGSDAAEIETFLATIPGRSPQNACKSAVCRLDDLRLGMSQSVTNSP